MTAMVRFDGVGLRYGRAAQGTHAEAGPEVLHDLSFELPEGAFRWLLGPSGAGKTSLLRLMYLAVRPTRGRLTLLGTDIDARRRRALPPLRRRIGVVFQDFRLLPHLSAFDNVALPLRIAGRPEGQIRADVGEMLRWVGLCASCGARPAELSGGEQQRVAIARAVIARPALLLADEPTGNLDEAQAERLMQLLKEMNRLGTTVVVATHNDALVGRHPARALRLTQGRLVAGTAGDGLAPLASSAAPAGFDDLGLRRALSDRMLPLLVGGDGVPGRAGAGRAGRRRVAGAALAAGRGRGADGAGAAGRREPAARAAAARLDRGAGAAARHAGRRLGARADRRGTRGRCCAPGSAAAPSGSRSRCRR